MLQPKTSVGNRRIPAAAKREAAGHGAVALCGPGGQSSLKMCLTVLLEMDDLLVVDKPAGQLMHPTRPGGPRTLLDALREAYPGSDLHLINRLDRETSGAVLIGRSRAAASMLGRMTQRGQITKTYHALVWGEPIEDAGRIEAPLGRLGARAPSPIFHKQAIVYDGRSSETLFWVERRLGNYSVLRIKPGHGRLHQIRVHLASIGFPVVGDKLYGPDERLYLDFIRQGWTEPLPTRLFFRRHALHASRLEFLWRGIMTRVSAPWPSDLMELDKSLFVNAL